MFWLIKGNTKSTIKNIVNGKIIQTLKKTHWSLVKFLQTISFKTAKKIKKIDHLNVNFFHITSSSLKAWNAIFKKMFNKKNSIEKNIDNISSEDKKIDEIAEIIEFINLNLKRGIARYFCE